MRNVARRLAKDDSSRGEPLPSPAPLPPQNDISQVTRTLRHREVTDEVEGTAFKHRIAEIHATSMKRLSKIEAPDDPADGAGEE